MNPHHKSRRRLPLLLLLLASCAGPEPAGGGVRSGPYLGEPLPGRRAEIFAPGVINRGYYTRDIAISPDGWEIYFGVQAGTFQLATLLVTRETAEGWSQPEVAEFASNPRWRTLEPFFSSDGNILYFSSDRPLDQEGEANKYFSLWSMARSAGKWGKPKPLSASINDGSSNFFPTLTRQGTLYFTRDLPDGTSAIFRSIHRDGDYSPPEKLPPEVNAGRSQFNALVAPDESFLVVPIYGLPDSRGATDYYIVFRNDDDSWTQPVNLGDAVNSTSGAEYSPSLSPDGKYLFFMSGRDRISELVGSMLSAEALNTLHNSPGNGQPAIWWIEAGFLEELDPRK